ncbi:MAG: lipocalin family protein [Planctomycetota bacterium]
MRWPLLLFGLIGCASGPRIPTAASVDLDRFMGDWYVLAHIPAGLEKNAYAAIESYALNEDGTIATTYTFREGSFDGEQKTYYPKGFVRNTETNAEWRMQFVWPIKAEYLINYVDDDYTQTIIGRSALDYLWIMARTPTIPQAEYDKLVARAADLGYDTSKIRKVPQQPER